MNFRMQTLDALIKHGPMTRNDLLEASGISPATLSGVLNGFIGDKGIIERHGVARDPTTTFSITEKGKAYFEANKNNPSTRSKQNGAAAVAPPSAPILPNLSVSAETLTDSVTAVLSENAELRQALVDMRSRINQLLGEETPIYFGGEANGTDSNSDSD